MHCRRRLSSLLVLSVLLFAGLPAAAKDVSTLEIGAPAPAFSLPGVDGKTHSLSDFSNAKVLVVIFTCNHCPTAQAYEDRIKQMYADYHDKGVAVVAISANDPKALRLDEMGYTDVGDSFDDMKQHAKLRGFTFPYLYDGDKQQVATEFGALATPHVFIFDQQRKLRYNGRIDDADIRPPKSHDARNAIDALLAGRPVPVEKTRVFGCTTKWSDKRDTVQQSIEKWNAEPVELETIDVSGVKKLAANKTECFQLVSVWSLGCIPCIAELPELVTINRMYRRRHFEWVTLCLDGPDQREAAAKVLRRNHVSTKNYIYASDNLDELAEALDKQWEGPLPYTILIAPGGEIVRRWKGRIDPEEVKHEISDRLGHTYASRKQVK